MFGWIHGEERIVETKLQYRGKPEKSRSEQAGSCDILKGRCEREPCHNVWSEFFKRKEHSQLGAGSDAITDDPKNQTTGSD